MGVPINAEDTAEEMLHQVVHSGIDVCITTNRRLADFKRVVERYSPQVSVYSVEDLLEILKVRVRALDPGAPDRYTAVLRFSQQKAPLGRRGRLAIGFLVGDGHLIASAVICLVEGLVGRLGHVQYRPKS
jgi:hypothetical protein